LPRDEVEQGLGELRELQKTRIHFSITTPSSPFT